MTGVGSPCGACKFLRRKCVRGCIFAPYFCHEQAAVQFSAIHKVFGASNVSKLLAHLPLSHRSEAALTISYEAQARLQDPVYGCVSHIFALQQQVVNLEAQLATLKAQETQCYANSSSSSSPSSSSAMQNNYNLCSEFSNLNQFSNSSMNHLYENGFMSSNSTNHYYGNGENDSFDMGDLQSVAIAYLNRN